MPAYPRASVSQLAVPHTVWRELDRRLVLLFLGRTHVSSEVHDRVIAGLGREGPSGPRLEALRSTAEQARDAVLAADLPALGRAMIRNTDAQGDLHASVIGKSAHLAIEVASASGALGWKVNGAGGEGGSITLLCGPDAGGKQKLIDALREADHHPDPAQPARRAGVVDLIGTAARTAVAVRPRIRPRVAWLAPGRGRSWLPTRSRETQRRLGRGETSPTPRSHRVRRSVA